MRITVETTVHAPLNLVWNAWTTPEDITKWKFASAEWCCPSAKVDFREGGKFVYRMESKDGTTGFDFYGHFTTIRNHEPIEFVIADGRKVHVTFSEIAGGLTVKESFEIEGEHFAEQQRPGWQNILKNSEITLKTRTTNSLSRPDLRLRGLLASS